jgi:hypothetical protein
LMHIQALVAELGLDVLINRVRGSAHRVWIGRRDLVVRAGGTWNPAWIAANGDPGAGGQLQDIAFGAACTVCHST